MTDGANPSMPTRLSLAELIRRHQDATGDSYADIARAAGLSKARVGQLAIGTGAKLPRDETLTKLAKGLRLPPEVVKRAALVSSGIAESDTFPDSDISVIADRLQQITPQSRQIIADLVDVVWARETKDG
ncbi:helix-turn-helix transcriptional regulator [Cellulosimicrobium sp. TH-20]|uniref:helix-turn-helix domain-containing protein n=1 Tax=Cellulosimicrobium sp. TH-20 TaxID=1980001 RepID=UPI00158150B1